MKSDPSMFVVVCCAIVCSGGGGIGAERKEPLAMQERILPRECWGKRPAGATIDTIVIHATSDCRDNPEAPYDLERNLKIFESYKVSAHYLIDRDGKVYRLVRESDRAFHAGKGKLPWKPETENKLNDTSIGIEVFGIGTKKEMEGTVTEASYRKIAPTDIGFTEKEYAALSRLLEEILRRHPSIKMDRRHIVGHAEYAAGRKWDPGTLFDWSKMWLRVGSSAYAPPLPSSIQEEDAVATSETGDPGYAYPVVEPALPVGPAGKIPGLNSSWSPRDAADSASDLAPLLAGPPTGLSSQDSVKVKNLPWWSTRDFPMTVWLIPLCLLGALVTIALLRGIGDRIRGSSAPAAHAESTPVSSGVPPSDSASRRLPAARDQRA